MEYESYNTGTLLYIGAEAGKAVPVNGVLAIIGEKDADWKTLLKAHEAKGAGGGSAAPATVGSETQHSTQETKSCGGSSGRIHPMDGLKRRHWQKN